MVSRQTISTVIILLLVASVGYILYSEKDSKTVQTATQEQYAYIASDMEQYTNPTYLG